MKNKRLLAFTLLLVLTGCSAEKEIEKQATPAPAPTNDNITNVHGKIENLERFQLFLNNVEKSQKDTIHMTMTTVEGDPIFQDVEYDGSKFRFTIDDSQDAFAGSGKGKKTAVCGQLSHQDTDSSTVYYLEGCEAPFADLEPGLIGIPKTVQKP